MWRRHLDGDDGPAEARRELIHRYRSLVPYVMGELFRGVPAAIDRNEIMSHGIEGLIKAIDDYSPGKGRTFEVWAIPKIEYAIRDFLRKSDWATRTQRTRIKMLEGAERDLAARLRRAPTDTEIIEYLRWNAELLGRVRSAAQPQSIEELGQSVDVVPALASSSGADSVHDLDDVVEVLARCCGAMPPEQSLILAMVLIRGLTLRQIARDLRVPEGRVITAYGLAVNAMRDSLTE